MSKTVRIVIIVGVILLAMPALMFRGQRSRSGAALAAYKAELRDKSERLSAEELCYPRPPESSGNLSRLLASVNQREAAQIETGLLELMHFVDSGRAQVLCVQPHFRAISTKVGRADADTWEIFSAQFETAAHALLDVRLAARRPAALFLQRPDQSSQPAERSVRALVQGRPMACWRRYCRATYRAARSRRRQHPRPQSAPAFLHREDLMLVSQMIRTAIAGLGLATIWEALQSTGWSKENLATL